MQQRAGRYLVSMGIRTLCVILVIVVPGPLRWVFAVGAIVLPYVAVVAANAAGERREPPLPPAPPSRLPRARRAPEPRTADERRASGGRTSPHAAGRARDRSGAPTARRPPDVVPVSLTRLRVILSMRALHPPSERARTPGGNPRGCPASALRSALDATR